MADVYLAMLAGPAGSGFSKLSVVKRLRPNLAEDPDFVAMLMDEARISARLNHANVVQTHEVGVEGESYYLAMEYLDGQPLHRIQRRSALSGKRVAQELEIVILSDVLAGLHHAHELTDYDGTPLNIVHRDVTPSNVFVTYGGHVKVVDFGIAKAAGRACETRQGVVKGKIRYMAPEQAMGLAIDRRADIFAVGILLWEALVAKRFWTAANDIDIARRLIAGEYDASPRSIDPSVPEELDRICMKAMAHAPHDRFESAEEMRRALDAYLAKVDTIALRKQLGPAVAALFTKERAQLRDIIDRAGRETAPVSIDALASSRSMSASLPPASAGSMRPTVLDQTAELPLPRHAPMLPTGFVGAPPPNAQPATGSYFLAAGAFLLTVAIVFAGLSSFSRDHIVEVAPARGKAIATHTIATHGQSMRVQQAAPVAAPADVQQDPVPPIVVQRPHYYAPAPKSHTKATPAGAAFTSIAPDKPPPVASAVADAKPATAEMHAPSHARRITIDTVDPWKAGGAPKDGF
jgi:serine/threonine protein kinase